ncbi:type II toxin-antitoxin system BrnA family antitoxin [Sphingomonas sp. DT-51]|uniref:type II toxin-antitoxin system BrnA family antitoxin n=1 Tax=Sphingomonas sp. DT-51 TaxID=3396165 RepID=UPI003F1A4E33
MSNEEVDRRFNAGEDISDLIERVSAQRINDIERVALDLPAWRVRRLDQLAAESGTTRQALIARWLAERLGGAA